jgi:hypothetical protein
MRTRDERHPECESVPRERLLRTLHGFSSEMEYLPLGSGGDQVTVPIGGLGRVELAQSNRPLQHAIALNQRQIGGNYDGGSA